MGSFEETLKQRIGPIADQSRQAEDEQRKRDASAREAKRLSEIAMAANRGRVTRVTSRIGELMPSIRLQWPFEGAQWHEHDESHGGRIIVPGQGKPLGEIDVEIRPEPSGVFVAVKATIEGSSRPVYRSVERRFAGDSEDTAIVTEIHPLLIDALKAFAGAAVGRK